MPCELTVTQSKGEVTVLEPSIKLTEVCAPESACCGFKATDATERGRYADTPPYVTANAKNGAPSTNQRPLPTRGTSRGLLRIVRVDRLPKDGVTAIITANKRQKQTHMKPDIYIQCVKIDTQPLSFFKLRTHFLNNSGKLR